MNTKAHTKKILKTLRSTYPNVKTQLNHRNPFELLLATILSAQCTDKQVNRVTKNLFNQYNSPRDFANMPIQILEKLVHSTGFYRNKAKNIRNCCQALIKNHNGRVPETMAELIALPGVGRKTANVVLGAAFGIPGVVVDTHVARISRRLGLTGNKDPVKIEFDLMKILPKKDWNDFSLQLIWFGREFCKARNPGCRACPLSDQCDYKKTSR